MKTRRAITVLTLFLAGCMHNRRAEDGALPRIDAVRPDSIVLPRGGFVDVAIIGTGFSADRNTIEFAGMTIPGVAADAAGRSIRFAIPDLVTRAGESPPALLEAGAYELRIRTSAGASNAMTVRVYR